MFILIYIYIYNILNNCCKALFAILGITGTQTLFKLHMLAFGLVAQFCLTLCDTMDCSPQSSSVHRDSPGKNTGVGCHALLQGIFPTQGSNPGLLHCRRTLYWLSQKESPRILEWIPIPSPGIFPTQELNRGLLHCRQILYQLSYEESPSNIQTPVLINYLAYL